MLCGNCTGSHNGYTKWEGSQLTSTTLQNPEASQKNMLPPKSSELHGDVLTNLTYGGLSLLV